MFLLPLVCIDVDGTLVGPSGVPSTVVWEAVDAALGRGQHLCLCTARGAFGSVWEFAQRVDPSGWQVFHNGASLVHVGSGEDRTQFLEAGTVELIRQQAEQRASWVVEYHGVEDYAVDSDHEVARAHAGVMGVQFRRRTLDELDGGVVRVQLIVPPGEVRGLLANTPEATVVSSATASAIDDAVFVSYTAAGATKATAIAEIAVELGIGVSEVMMVGDGHNDIDAMRAVGHGVAMGNADETVKDAARHVVATVEQDGLAEALELSVIL